MKHSQKMNEVPADAWVLANINGKIICAHCTCTAGLSETCSHVGAICFAVASMKESSNIVIVAKYTLSFLKVLTYHLEISY